MSTTTLEELRHEYATNRIGARWLDEIRSACTSVSRGFNPAVYAVAEQSWSPSEIDELVQDVTVEELLRQGQLGYIVETAETLVDVRRLLRYLVRRALIRRRKRTVVDRLIERLSELLRADYEEVEGVAPTRFRPRNSGFPTNPPSATHLRLAAGRVRLLPISSSTSERAPAVFRTEVLREVARQCFEATRTSLALSNFDEILTAALTSWLPVILELDDEVDPAGSTETRMELEEVAMTIIGELSDADRLVLRSKLSGESDSDLAARLDVSRPTAAKHKIAAYDSLRNRWLAHAPDLTGNDAGLLAQLVYRRLIEDGAA